jgi:hypothetical protein
MTVRQLIAHLLNDNNLDDEILVAYWDKEYFIDQLDLTEPHKLDEIWADFIKSGQETINGHLEFTQTGYDLSNDLQTIIQEREDCGN